ncbi:ARM repeat-containing protein [Hypoxylon fragiforme]|uniref:ARM repeat-containing protein n=1 Tax=Hypoxylon fragiforme TaxID=63214 RepID=UPI0020C6C37B|nr:ARM repeat-containing protein [Hypoxylon fragiforme]KAI2613135.1 ARM repeat-containing protein [Hypoxylon fragiforme]
MPPRAPGRSTRNSAAVSKASTAAQPSRASPASRRSSSNADIPEEAPESQLRTQICAIFRDAQKTTATHRKLVVNLRKIHEACCYEPTRPNKNTPTNFDESDFNNEFSRCVLRIMPVKKSESVGEKTIRFVGLFLRHANDKDNELLGEEDVDASTMPETPSTRLTTQVLEAILPLLTAKDKFVRYRATQLISHVINSLDAIDDDLFQKLRHGLLKRIRDKEAMVRSQAVLGLGRLAGNEVEGMVNSDDSDDAETGLLDKLLEVLQNDPSADVRRSLLVNLPILPNTLRYLLERARDQDPATRRAVYSRLLPALSDFRYLSVLMREKLLRWGLRDRDENVRKAAGRLFRERWIEDCARANQPEDEENPNGTAPPTLKGLLELLERIEVVNSGVENGVALEAMKGFWEGRPDYRDFIEFDDNFWKELSAESVFIARSFNHFCRTEGNGKYEFLTEKLPEVTDFAYLFERELKILIEVTKRVNSQANVEDETELEEERELEEKKELEEKEFILEQLLHIILTLDYSDEAGRRAMFSRLRQALSIPELPDEITKLTIEALRDICAPDAAGEKEFCSIVLEAVADVHDTIVDESAIGDGEESFHSARSEVSGDSTPTKGKKGADSKLTEEEAREKEIKEIMINLKCLHIVQCMLSNVEGLLQENDHLVAMLNNLVVPAVRSTDAPVRERGLVCLGLCALLDRELAEENLTLFMHFFSKGHAALQITALQILTDILNVHGAQLLSANPALLKVYVKALRSGAKYPEVQDTATVAVCKLLLGRVVTDEDVSSELLKTLVVAYFDPSTAGNQGVRQALNYFLPVFCYSRVENQELMGSIALDALHALYNVREGIDDDAMDVSDEMASLNTIGACLVDWTDPRKCYTPGIPMDADKKNVNGDVHLDLARAILEKLESNFSKEEKKVIAPLLGKLYISPASSEDKIRALYEDISSAVEDNLMSDATGRNALYKIHVSLGKIVNQLAADQDKASLASGSNRRSVSVGAASVGGASSRRSRSVSLAPAEDPIPAATAREPVIEEEEEEEEGDGEVEEGEEEEEEEDEIDEADVSASTVRRRSGGADSLVEELLSDDGET